MEVLIIIYSLGLILLEIYVIDPFYWKKGKSDKPFSTVVFYILSLLVVFYNVWFLAIPIVVRVCFFDPLLNISGELPSGKQPLCYHPEKNWYEKVWAAIPCWLELTIRVVVFLLPLGVYYL